MGKEKDEVARGDRELTLLGFETNDVEEELINRTYKVLSESLEKQNLETFLDYFENLPILEQEYLERTREELNSKSLLAVIRKLYEEKKELAKNPLHQMPEKNRSSHESALNFYIARPDTPIPESKTLIRISDMRLISKRELERITKNRNVEVIQFTKSVANRLTLNKRKFLEDLGIQIRVAD